MLTTQIHNQLKTVKSFSQKHLLDCLTEVKAWMTSSCLNFNEDKTEVNIFGPGVNHSASSSDFNSLEPFVTLYVKFKL